MLLNLEAEEIPTIQRRVSDFEIYDIDNKQKAES